ncbi:solute carrier family 13 member 2-like isoform X2 [Varroa destructor]|uniref:Uncharacterized protein n=1 Tax=Varroa destructor TaxID=109461 RepID=A0A7M7KXF9_VARDE|nr:solute carrier family 13 member 2-like isoform X2 [Varroa destructor]
MFPVPRDPTKWATSPAILVIHEEALSSVVFLIGGSMALSDGVQVSSLSTWIGDQMGWLQDVPPVPLAFLVLLTAMCLTKLRNAGAHSLLILLPVAFCCSDASVFSVATAPNAIIADSSGMTTYEMVGVKNNYSYNVATQRRIQVKAYLVAEQQTTGCMSVIFLLTPKLQARSGLIMKLICLTTLMIFTLVIVPLIFNVNDLSSIDFDR